MLRQRHPIAPEQGGPGEVHGLGARRVAPQQQRNAGGIAEGELAIRALKSHAPASQAVERGRPDQRLAIAADAGVEVIRDDEQDIGSPVREGRAGGRGKARPNQERRHRHHKGQFHCRSFCCSWVPELTII